RWVPGPGPRLRLRGAAGAGQERPAARQAAADQLPHTAGLGSCELLPEESGPYLGGSGLVRRRFRAAAGAERGRRRRRPPGVGPGPGALPLGLAAQHPVRGGPWPGGRRAEPP
ncbi:unnamed protein product, partial [Effrenium voratum]